MPGLKFSSGLWSGDDAQLLHHPQVVIDQPALGDLAVVHTEYGDAGYTDILAGGGNPLHLTLVRTGEGGSGNHSISFSDYIFDGLMSIREGRCEHGEPLFHDIQSGRKATAMQFDVIDQEFLGKIMLFIVQNLMIRLKNL